MLRVGPLAVVAVLRGNRTLLNARSSDTDAHTDRTADTIACAKHFHIRIHCSTRHYLVH